MESVASFLQYGSSPYVVPSYNTLSEQKYEPTEEELKAKEVAYKRQRAKDTALVIISTAEKLMISGLEADVAFERAEAFFEKANALMAQKTEE